MKILIVEDEAGISEFLKQGLEEEGFQVITASDGQMGNDIARRELPDLILLDWILPKMLGIDVCKSIRARDTKTPIIFLTAKDTIQETIEGLKAGANDYIKKPFSFEELLLRIKVQRTTQGTMPDVLRLGTIEINRNSHQVFESKREVILTQKEFSLLEYLITNKGKVCTRTNIIADVWDIHFDYDTGVIDVFMNSLRKKLNLTKEKDFIKTIRGVGYIAQD